MTAPAQPALEARHLTKRYNGFFAVRDVNFSVPTGAVLAMLGPNGAGKSTLVSLLTTLLRPSAGDAILCGYSLRSDRAAIRARTGVVFQQSMLDGDLSVTQNLDFQARVHHFSGKARARGVARALEVAGLDHRSRSRVRELSGGMRRRLEIASALLHEPTVLFLDEPTTGLDIEARQHIWQELKRLRERSDLTMVLTTHYLEEADSLADLVAILDRGRLRAFGTPDQLKQTIQGDIVEARVVQPDQQLADALRRVEQVVEVAVRGDRVTVKMAHAERSVPAMIALLQQHSERILSFELHKPSLNDVFLQTTGHVFHYERST